MNALEHVRPGNGFMPNFQLFQKSEINGINRIPLYQWALVNISYVLVVYINTMKTTLDFNFNLYQAVKRSQK